MPTVLQTRRTLTPNLAPPNLSLAEGELAVELATAPNPKLWVGVPTTIDVSGKRLVADLSQGGRVAVSDTPPTPIVNGDLWWDSGTDLQLYVGYDDGTSQQWVAASNPPSPPVVKPVIISDAPPTVENGALWWDSGASLQLYVGYDDGTSQQWVAASALSLPPAAPTPPAKATVSISPPNQPGTTDQINGVMIGYGLLGMRLTPTVSGTVSVTATGAGYVDVANGGGGIVIYYGTGAAPANGAPVPTTGRTGGGPYMSGLEGLDTVPIAHTWIISGLTIGTDYWFDVRIISAGAPGTLFAFVNVAFVAAEI